MNRLGTTNNSWGVSKEKVSLIRIPPTETPISFPAKPQDLEADLGRTALIVVDMQNDFCASGGWLASIGVQVDPLRSIIGTIQEVTDKLRTIHVPIIWLNWGNRPDRANLPPGVLHVYNPDGQSIGIGDPLPGSMSPVLQLDSWSAATIDELKSQPEDLNVAKYRMSGFFDTALDSILRNMNVNTLLFAGVNLDQCVFATLIDGASLGYDVVLLSDCCATTSPQFCVDATHYNVAQCFGFVATSADLISAINAPKENSNVDN